MEPLNEPCFQQGSGDAHATPKRNGQQGWAKVIAGNQEKELEDCPEVTVDKSGEEPTVVFPNEAYQKMEDMYRFAAVVGFYGGRSTTGMDYWFTSESKDDPSIKETPSNLSNREGSDKASDIEGRRGETPENRQRWTRKSTGLKEVEDRHKRFTWSNHRHGQDSVQCKLDWCLVNDEWRASFGGKGNLKVQTYASSDHCALIYQIREACDEHKCKKPFRFFKPWLMDKQGKDVMLEAWSGNVRGCPMMRLMVKLNRVRMTVLDRNKNSFGNLADNITNLQSRLEVCRDRVEQGSEGALNDEHMVRQQLSHALLMEEECWEMVKTEVVHVVQNFFSSGQLVRSANETMICLIPKKDNFNKVEDFRLISLCNTTYKIIAKDFECLAGMKVNMQKSMIFARTMVDCHMGEIQSILPWSSGSLPSEYLGLPLFLGNLPKDLCLPLLTKVEKRLAGWKARILSYAGRLCLIGYGVKESLRRKIWASYAPAKSCWYSYIACEGRLPTLDRIQKTGIHLANRCSFCYCAEEANAHVLINFKIAKEVWRYIASKFDKANSPQGEIADAFKRWIQAKITEKWRHRSQNAGFSAWARRRDSVPPSFGLTAVNVTSLLLPST
ncbi:hypothetical protein EJ110_NYTH40347 [Nymphaea thermarum]|nr:hypothetical protein EJ110_NYTH40347 [Nymphaea thermarum]